MDKILMMTEYDYTQLIYSIARRLGRTNLIVAYMFSRYLQIIYRTTHAIWAPGRVVSVGNRLADLVVHGGSHAVGAVVSADQIPGHALRILGHQQWRRRSRRVAERAAGRGTGRHSGAGTDLASRAWGS